MCLEPNEQALFEAVAAARASRTPMASRGQAWGLSLAQAYRVQAAAGEGRMLKGYKLGLTSPAKQVQMGMNAPAYGRVYADMLLEDEAPLSRFVQPRLEPEVAVILREPVPAGAGPMAAWRAVSGVFLAVDILDSVWAGYRFTAQEVVADNTSGGAFFLDPRISADHLTGTLRLYLNGELRAEGPVEDLGDPGDRLAWLASQADGLYPGQVIFLGSPAASVPAEPGVIEVMGQGGRQLVARLVP